MKSPLILTALLFLLSISVLPAGLIIVAADGSGNATTIQAGINMAAVSDTVIVSRGIWTEAVIIDNKPIILGSYFIVDGDTTHISQTVIDGEDARTGIIIENCSGDFETLKVIGPTVRNCRSNWYPTTDDYSIGGGIGIGLSVAKVIKCKLYGNRAYYGGGIGVLRAHVYLYGNSIHSNNAIASGGGLSGLGYNNMYIYFDSDNRNSIYLNNASRGNDISYAYHNFPTVVYLDKGSVGSLDLYFFFLPDQTPLYVGQPVIEQVNQDLWVSPTGSNANNGFSPDSPLKNISFALAKIQPIGSIPLSVHVLPGTYSWNQNGEALPLQLKSYVNVIGTDMESVILDAEQYGTFVCGKDAQDYFVIKNLSLINGHSTHYYLFYLDDFASGYTNSISVQNIRISDSWVKFDAFRIMSCHNLTVDNLIIEDSQVGNGFNIYVYETGNFSNFRVQRLSSTNYHMYNSSCTGGGIAKPLRAASLNTTIDISNFLITDIVDTSQFWQNMPSGLSIGVEGGNCDLKISNCTIANNSSVTQSGGLNFSLENCNVEVYNTIVTGNSPYEVAISAFDESSFADVSFTNCLITGGSDSFFHLSGEISHTWAEGNLYGLPNFKGGDILDPLYYSLSAGSPCIDAGTPDTSMLDLPPCDLAGNQRVWNSIIDMGAFEYGSQPWVSNDDPVAPDLKQLTLFQNYPNPFNPRTSISYILPEPAQVRLDIYNIKGQLVKTLIDTGQEAGLHQIAWYGRDVNNRNVASGVYFYRLSTPNGIRNRRMLLMK